MKTSQSLSILNSKAKKLYYKIEDIVTKLMQDNEWSLDGQTQGDVQY